MGNDKRRGHDLETEDALKGDGSEIVGHKGRVVTCIFKQRPMNAIKNFGEIGSGAAARVQDTDGGAGEAKC